MKIPSPLNLKGWIEENRQHLKPPVGNRLVWQDTEFTVMVVGGPNTRKDFHIDPGEEWFYQIEGDMILKVIEDGQMRDIPIREGEMFLLPSNVPHSPQRFPNTIGMVIERKRLEGEMDHLRWYCENCNNVLHDVQFFCTDLGTQLKPVIEEFHGSEALRTCKTCNTVMQVPGT
ncbi:MAG: 3-hydroxyanthranilate 3,4-dioxygenase [Candidatus Eisenbacteria bacterium]|uniref:3-hydroxyanthranilate 3,4-dioxygenase n=1 Tax=Eiseniibacteriota bacterium TaxID=2212470 RepID=A0A7Y2EA77_UNCEI|nr:3-hydroxyanthranilate 3,4-dioxygenase [Candidatus Eisenbacteria bacterium]